MKGLFLFFIAFVFSLHVNGQKPESFYYQALVRNETGQLVVSKPVSFRISILAGSAAGVVTLCTDRTNAAVFLCKKQVKQLVKKLSK